MSHDKEGVPAAEDGDVGITGGSSASPTQSGSTLILMFL
jgi:hypothetical protein